MWKNKGEKKNFMIFSTVIYRLDRLEAKIEKELDELQFSKEKYQSTAGLDPPLIS
ncbi:MAG: hypothetical protein ACFE9L_02840 [Candidatus Hodarchaeota archaeon]